MNQPVASPLLNPLATATDRALGALLIDAGKLSPDGVESILRAQHQNPGLRFGEAAVQLGLVRAEDVQHALSRQFSYAYLAPGDESLSPEIIAAFRPYSPFVEQLRALRSQLMLRWFTGAPNQRAITVVSAERGEGRSFLVANLAVVFSQLGQRTLLIDADLRTPRQHQIFKLDNRTGLSNVLAGRGGIEAIVRVPSMSDLSVLPAGTIPPNPQELLGRPALEQLVDELAVGFDVILLDSPAAAHAADAQMLARVTGGVVVLARRDATQIKRVQDLAGAMEQAGARLVGAIFNDF